MALLLPAPGIGRCGLTSTIVWIGPRWRTWWCNTSASRPGPSRRRWWGPSRPHGQARRHPRNDGPSIGCGCRCWCWRLHCLRLQFVDLGIEIMQCLWIMAKQFSELAQVLITGCFPFVEVHRPLHLVLRSGIVPPHHPSAVPFGILDVALRLPLAAGQASNVTMTSRRISENNLCFLCVARNRVQADSTCSHGCSSIH